MKKLLTMAGFVAATTQMAFAQDTKESAPTVTGKKFYTSSSLDGSLISLNSASNKGFSNIPRFSYFVNTGINFNYDLSHHFGVFAGVSIKNMGFIDKSSTINPGHEVTIKHRVYAAGIPAGIKIGNLGEKGTFLILGGGVDFPLNYKEKIFTDSRKYKTKRNEWFSEEVEPIMPYVFAGLSIKSKFTVKLQYYTGNFMSDDYWLNVPAGQLGGNYDTHLAMLSFSFYVKNKHNGQTRKAFRAMWQQKRAAKKA